MRGAYRTYGAHAEADEDAERDAALQAERFREYASTGNREIRNQLIVSHVGLARALARRYRGRGERAEDLDQVAAVGLVKAVERFDPRRGVMFSTFAVPTIVGELKRHFRGQWIVRVPRSLQEKVLDLSGCMEELTARLGRSPTVPELARAMGEHEEAVLEAMEARLAFTAVPTETSVSEGAEPVPGALVEHDDGLAAVERAAFVTELLDHLPAREAEVMRLRFFDDLTQSEIAARVGLSQMQVSRLIRRSLDKLRVLAGI